MKAHTLRLFYLHWLAAANKRKSLAAAAANRAISR
jgi:hypothetical protein